MYSVKQINKVAAQLKMPAQKSFYASSQPSSNSMLHFSYRLVDLQKEIEKRTFYLGKYRKTEEASHLLDLIGMSRDEGDLLYPFTKAAMGDVYDQLNISSLHIPKSYEFRDQKEPIKIVLPKQTSYNAEGLKAEPSDDNKAVVISGTLTTEALPLGFKQVGLEVSCTISYDTRYKVLGTNISYEATKSIDVKIPKEYIRRGGQDGWNVIPYTVQLLLEPQSNITSAETITSASVTVNEVKYIHGNPKALQAGEIIEVTTPQANPMIQMTGAFYEVIEDTDENNIDLTTQAIQVDDSETMVEGIHYYLSVPNYVNMTSVAPLDNAIMEALVNRIIWKWLVLSFPAEAATYDTLYQDNLKSIAMRCNIFNKHWQQVPRIL